MKSRFTPLPILLLWAGCGSLLLPGCIEPYAPNAISTPASYLVVEGFINVRGRTLIRLSRTVPLAALSKTTPVLTRAALLLEAQRAGNTYQLHEITPGTYASDSLWLEETEQYRLRIRTQNNSEYASSFVPVLLTPPLDSVRWQSDNTSSLTIRLDTHDDTGRARYLRWEGIETWEIPPIHNPSIEYVGGKIRPIQVPYPRLCWNSQPVTAIRLANTAPLNSSVVEDLLYHSLPILSSKLVSRYSLLVRQFAISKEEYDYWNLLQKNTESLGTLSDPQPVQLTGNVQCLNDPTQPVLGYVGAHSQTEKRIFIKRTELLNSLAIASEYDGDCKDLYLLRPSDLSDFNNSWMVPVDIVISPFGISGYSWSTPYCIDCRLRGTAVRPSYWPPR